MSAVLTALRAELRRRRLQSLIIALVILLSSGAGTLALSLLVESDAPYDHAFAQANGAHLTIMYDTARVDAARVAGTAHAHGVTAAAGPFLQVSVLLGANPRGDTACAGCAPLMEGVFSVIGRDRPDPAVDRLTMESGRWARAPGEIVLSRRMADAWGLGVGDTVTVEGGNGASLRVVGVAASVDDDMGAWVTPGQAPSLAAEGTPARYQMFYRVISAGSTAALAAAAVTIAAGLPAGAVVNVSNYLDAKRQADLLSAVMVPFLLAFSAFALLAAMFIIANVVSGVVVAGYREIGVMKAIGFTPGQVGAALLGQILAPALAGCAIGIPLGMLVSQPFLQDTAHALNLPSPFTAALPVGLGVLAVTVLVAFCAAAVPCWRAGRLSAVTAMTRGSAPTGGRGAHLGRYLSGLRLPRPMELGLAEALARPMRSLMTMGAVLIGVATTVFALSLHLSLTQVAQHLIRDQYVQVDVQRDARPTMSIQKQITGGKSGDVPFGSGAPAPASDRQVTALLAANPGTERFVAETQDQVYVPGISAPIPYYAYRGPSGWIGYALTAGRWFTGPGEVVAPTKLLEETHLAIGRYFTAHMHGRTVRLRLVGEILDQTGDDLLLRGDWSTLASVAPGVQPQSYEVALKPGTNPDRYVQAIQQQSGGSVDPSTVQRSSDDTSFILLNTVIGGLASILIVVAVAGVFNTVVLSTREKTRDIAILKAVGMEPRQVVTMVLSSVAFLGLIAGFLGIPAGIVLHRQVLQFMGQVASGTAIPPAFFDLINHAELPLLAITGVAVAAVGAWLPARWAAANRVAAVLQAE